MDDIYYEWQQIGSFAKVTAIDSQSLCEVCVIVPAKTAQVDAHRLAYRKLKRVLESGD